ncbi:MAG: hypothetical protein PHG66_00670 [Candidatus Colwellbacteria bacterium]|nr:hypothetical protein [Candidatus Colwellbacteria bacterium]
MSCPSGKIVNPASGRCVSKTGKIGKSLLGSPKKSSKKSKSKKSKSRSRKKSKNCKSDKVKNPSSGRCVSKTGKIGKKIIESEDERDERRDELESEDDRDERRDELESEDESEYSDDDHDDKYIACYNQVCGKKSNDGYFDIVTLPEGSRIFRNMRSNLKKKTPAWFSDPKIAAIYGGLGPNCHVFEIKKDLQLIDVTISKNIKTIYESDKISGADKEIISLVTGYNSTSLKQLDYGEYPEIFCSEYNKKDKSKIVFCPVGFFSSKDKKKNIYINLRLAKIVCKMGYDGWIIPPKAVIDKSTNTNYNHEVLICNPGMKLKHIKNKSCGDY